MYTCQWGDFMNTYAEKKKATVCQPQKAAQQEEQFMPQLDAMRNVDVHSGHLLELGDDLKRRIEQNLGYELSGVELRESQDAADMGAEAFAKGNVVHFAPGYFNQNTQQGQHLIVHEISHVVQQAKGNVSADVDGLNVNASDQLESAADHTGDSFLSAGTGHTSLLSSLPAMNAESAPIQGSFFSSIKNFFSKKKETQNQLIDTEKMNFGKRAYRSDDQYKSLEGLMNQYNSSGGSNEARIALMDAAMKYIDSTSHGKKQVHKGRTQNAEDILLQLSVLDGSRESAMRNYRTLKDNMVMDTSPLLNEEHIAEEKRTLGVIGEAASGQSERFSGAMSAIAANVLADQGRSKVQASTVSNAKRIMDPNAAEDYSYLVNGRAILGENNHMDNVGTLLHELTHVSAGESFDNTRLFFTADKESSRDDLLKRRDDRVHRFSELLESGESVNYRSKDGTYDKNVIEGRKDYALGSKMSTQYAPNFQKKIDEDLAIATGENREALEAEKNQIAFYGDVFDKKAERTQSNILYNERKKLEAQKSPKNNERLNQIQAQLEALSKAQITNSDSMIEYDSVINQLLVQYEMATNDRSSQHYRQLKAAALRAHTDRVISKLKNRSRNPGQHNSLQR